MRKGVALERILNQAGNFSPMSSEYVQRLVKSGCQCVRFTFSLDGQPAWTPDMLAYQQAVVDTLIRKAKVQVIGQFAPDLINWTQADWNDSPDSIFAHRCGVYARMASQIAFAMPELVGLEVWNEGNAFNKIVKGKKVGGTYIAPERYWRLMTAVHTAVKAANPKAQIILGGLLAHSIGGKYTQDNAGVTYLRAMYDQAPLPSLAVPWDHVGLHLYLDRGGALSTPHLEEYLGWYSDLMNRRHLTTQGSYLHITETGWSTHVVSEAVQAANLRAVFDVAGNHGGVGMCLWYSLVDTPEDASPERWGLLSSNLDMKVAYGAFLAVPKGL